MEVVPVPLISPENAELYRKIHARDSRYGSGGRPRSLGYILDKLTGLRRTVRTVLDYGCGKGVLSEMLRERGFVVVGYDPAIAGKDKLPDRQFDAVVSRDVLEHVEPEYIDVALKWIADHAKVVQVHRIAMGPAPDHHNLDNGRNAHYIIEQQWYWLDKLSRHGTRGEWAIDKPGGHLDVTLYV